MSTAADDLVVFDEPSLERWMGRTLKALHSGFVTRRRPLAHLMQEARPATETTAREPFLYDPMELRRWVQRSSEEEQGRLRLPLTLNFDSEVHDSCFLEDEVGAAVLRRLEGFDRAYPWRDGRMWIPYSLGFELLWRYPTTLQRLFRG